MKRAIPERVRAQLERLPIASPLDRLAAAIIDHAIILLPILYLVVAPFQRLARIAALYDNTLQITLASLLGAFSVLLVVIGYQTFCVWRWGRTPGQLFIGLKVRNLWAEQQISFTQALMRSLYWVVSLLLLGVPLLALFSNYMRRTFYDRVTDTVVVSQRIERSAGRPSLQEASLVQGVYWAVAVAMVLTGTSFIFSQLLSLQKQSELIQSLEREDRLCAVISEAQSEWPRQGEIEPERLGVAMTLYAAGTIDVECLAAEVKNLYAEDEESPLLSLAKSFIYSSHQDLSDRYLAQVCALAPKSDECQMSELVSAVADRDERRVEQKIASLQPNGPLYMLIWVARQYLRSENYGAAKLILDRIPSLRSLSDFNVVAHAKVFWGLGQKEEAKGVSFAAYSTLSEDAQEDIAGFMCFEEIWSSCENFKNANCEQFEKQLANHDGGTLKAMSSLAYLRTQECRQKGTYLDETVLGISLHDDVRAMLMVLRSQKQEELVNFLLDRDIDGGIRNELLRRYIISSRDEKQLDFVRRVWEEGGRTLSWRHVGDALAIKYSTFNAAEKSLQISKLVSDKNVLREGSRLPASESDGVGK